VRGGSWNNNRDNARCAYRNRNEPSNFNNNLGFRLVLSTFYLPARSAVCLRAAAAAKWLDRFLLKRNRNCKCAWANT
jgi:hypothetical protein